MKRLVTISLLTLALGCTSTGGGGSGSGGGLSEGDDPGLRGDGGFEGGVEASSEGFSTVYFAFDDYSLGSDAKGALQANAQLLKGNSSISVEIQGNCDERGTEEYNLALGQRRADTARRYLIDFGVSAGQVSTVSFGESNPAVQGHSESAWTKNRRADFARR